MLAVGLAQDAQFARRATAKVHGRETGQRIRAVLGHGIFAETPFAALDFERHRPPKTARQQQFPLAGLVNERETQVGGRRERKVEAAVMRVIDAVGLGGGGTCQAALADDLDTHRPPVCRVPVAFRRSLEHEADRGPVLTPRSLLRETVVAVDPGIVLDPCLAGESLYGAPAAPRFIRRDCRARQQSESHRRCRRDQPATERGSVMTRTYSVP